MTQAGWTAGTAPSVHSQPAPAFQWQNMTQDQVNSLRANLIESILQVVVQAVTGFLLPGGAFGQLLSWAQGIPLFGQLISLFVGSGSGLTGLGGLGSILSDFLGLFGLNVGGSNGLGTGSVNLPSSYLDIPLFGPIFDLLSHIPIVGGLIDLFFNFITGGSGSGHSLGDLSGVIGQIPIFGQLIEMFVGSGSGLTGAGGFGSIISDFLGLFGGLTGLGTGTVGLPGVGSIPILGPLINEFISLFGGTGSGLGGLTSIFTDFLGLLGLGGANGLGTGSPTLPSNIPLLGSLFSGLGLGNLADLINWLNPSNFLDQGGVFGKLIELLLGGPGSLFDLGTFFGLNGTGTAPLTVPFTIPGTIGSVSNGGVFAPLLQSLFGNTGLGDLSQIFGFLGDFGTGSSLVSQLLGAITGNPLTGGGGLGGLLSFFTDFLGIFGLNSGSGLGSGNIIFSAISQIPIFGPIFDTFIGLFNGASGLSGLGGLTSIFSDFLGLFGTPFGLGSGSPNATIPALNVGGVQGLLDIGDTIQNTWNNLTTAFGGATVLTNERQQIVLGGAPTGGTFRLSYNGQTTTSLAFNATAGAIQTALTNLTSIGSGNLVATGGPMGTGPILVTFQGAMAGVPAQLIGHIDSLTGGAGPQPPAVAIAEITRGGPITTLTDLTSLAQQQTNNALGAFNLSTIHDNILSFRQNQPAHQGLEETTESTVPFHTLLASFNGVTPTAEISVTASSAVMGFLRTTRSDKKGFVQWLGSGNSNISTLKVNVYKMDKTTGALNLLHTSPDLHAGLTPGYSWQTYTFSGPNQTPVVAGDVLAAEIVTTGSGTHKIAGVTSSWLPQHPTAQMKTLAAARNPSTLGASPTSIAAGSIGWAGATPSFGFGISNVPSTFTPDTTTQFTSAGVHTYVIPDAAKVVGAKLRCVAVGGGGAGQGEQGWNLGQGGLAGSFNGVTLVCGTHYPTTATSITLTVGAGGPQQITYFANGNPGAASTIQWTDPSSVVQTVTAAGGDGGSGFGFGYSGEAAGNYTFDGATYYGGASVGSGSSGNPPGGGGGGAPPFLFGGAGADGAIWVTAIPAPT